MPNGRPGDNPYTDIVHWDAELYTEEIREHVISVRDYENSGAIKRVSGLLWDTPTDSPDKELEELERELASIHEAVENAENYSSESPLQGCLNDNGSVYSESIRELVRDIHDQLQEEIDEKDRGRSILSGLLWQLRWEPDDLEEVESELREFREEHWIWDH